MHCLARVGQPIQLCVPHLLIIFTKRLIHSFADIHLERNSNKIDRLGYLSTKQHHVRRESRRAVLGGPLTHALENSTFKIGALVTMEQVWGSISADPFRHNLLRHSGSLHVR
ncbi:hypothetical protein GOODEAATRI_022327 [Goodea atripinnis]|uniref:Secreted protein n=1 Tax=Goodea atripinnis TaxID=208336 RepID=A0ABV0NCS0_9TELE